MAFDDLHLRARNLILELLEAHGSGEYAPEFYVKSTHEGWVIQLKAVNAVADKELRGFTEGDLIQLEVNNYLTHDPTRPDGTSSLSQKAFEQFHLNQVASRLRSRQPKQPSPADSQYMDDSIASAMTNTTHREQVFFSYSHKDKKWLERFQTALKPLIRANQLSVWDDTKIKAGDVWRHEIKQALASAKVAVLLVSMNFLESDFIDKHELPPLLEAEQNEGLRILLVVVGHSLFEETELARYQAVNDASRPLASMPAARREKEIVRICKEIKAAAVPTKGGRPNIKPDKTPKKENLESNGQDHINEVKEAFDRIRNKKAGGLNVQFQRELLKLLYISHLQNHFGLLLGELAIIFDGYDLVGIRKAMTDLTERRMVVARRKGETVMYSLSQDGLRTAAAIYQTAGGEAPFWNNPRSACSLLSNISGLQTGGYKSTGVEGDFFCCSPYKDLDKDSPLPNNIAYYAEGDAEEVNRLKLVLNVNDPEKAEAAYRVLMIYSNELACKALGEELRPKMQDAILAGRPYAYKVGELFVELKVEAWVTERGYDMKFIITQPINIPSPLKAKVGYEPDETARRILVFLAKPQHQHVYAVEINEVAAIRRAKDRVKMAVLQE